MLLIANPKPCQVGSVFVFMSYSSYAQFILCNLQLLHVMNIKKHAEYECYV